MDPRRGLRGRDDESGITGTEQVHVWERHELASCAEELQVWIKACQDPEEVRAAVKIQSIARGKRDRQRVKDKKMTYEKFAAKVAQRLGTMDPEKIFAKVDKTNDGTIDSKEFSSLVRSIAKGETYTKELLRAAWLAAVGGDATKMEISAEELQAWIKACQNPDT